MKAYISYIAIVSQGIDNIEDLKNISSIDDICDKDIVINTTMIPAMVKRRCSKASKIGLSLAISQLEITNIRSAVFCSQHGELTNTISLFSNIMDNEVLSPNKFSQSVHNTASGLLSVQKKLTIPFNSIAASKETFQMGLIDAYLQLHDYESVLFVMFDDNVPVEYKDLKILYDLACGVSFIVSSKPLNSSSVYIDISMQANNDINSTLPPALVFAKWMNSDKSKPLLLKSISIKELVQ